MLEGRGVAREVGIAALEKDTGRVSLIQVRGQGYKGKTLNTSVAARRQSDIYQDPSSATLALTYPDSGSGHVLVDVGCLAVLRREETFNYLYSCSMYAGRIRRSSRTCHAQVLERDGG